MVNDPTTTYATLFKILRIIMLVAVVLLFSRIHQHNQSLAGNQSTVQSSWRRALPWYVIGFVVLCALNSWLHFDPAISGLAHGLSVGVKLPLWQQLDCASTLRLHQSRQETSVVWRWYPNRSGGKRHPFDHTTA